MHIHHSSQTPDLRREGKDESTGWCKALHHFLREIAPLQDLDSVTLGRIKFRVGSTERPFPFLLHEPSSLDAMVPYHPAPILDALCELAAISCIPLPDLCRVLDLHPSDASGERNRSPTDALGIFCLAPVARPGLCASLLSQFAHRPVTTRTGIRCMAALRDLPDVVSCRPAPFARSGDFRKETARRFP